jgi:hypothetical protein
VKGSGQVLSSAAAAIRLRPVIILPVGDAALLTERVRKVIPSLTTSRPVWDAISLVTIKGNREDVSLKLFDGFITGHY